MEKRLKYWLPPIAWMIMLFIFSSRQSIAVTHEFTSDFIIFKTLHIIEYAMLFFLVFRATFNTGKKPLRNQLLQALIISVAYSVFDEYHQTFTPTRSGSPRDIFIDLIGISGMYLYINLHLDKLRRFLS